MKTTIVFLLRIALFCYLTITESSAQDKFSNRALTPSLPSQLQFGSASHFKIAGKRASQYTADDWRTLIDSTWGPGQGATTQIQIFDKFWSMIDQQWAGFPNLSLNWDSMRTVYRPQIGSGLSRGRFYVLMSRMWWALMEHHTWIYDGNVESIFGTGEICQFKHGVPLLCFQTGWWDPLGAAATPMPDSSGLIYRTAPGNPLGLEPGDLILGYEGIPWKNLYRQLLDFGLPVSRNWSAPASTPESRIHMILSGVGFNWAMFDTIDVVRYSTGDTLHLPTAPLSTYTPTLWESDQVPIAGVPMPQGAYNGTVAVSYGVVQGTNIGYVYAWDWATTSTPQLFTNAINDLRNNKKVDGLILDFRLNWGGNAAYANGGLSQLFNFDPTSNMFVAKRNDLSNHFGFSLSSASGITFTPTAYCFDRPIAVLIGPTCVSAGDHNAFRMRFHPMARFFGKPTNGASAGGDYATGTIPDAWLYQLPTNIVYSNVPGEGYFIHKGVQPDEEVWLTREGVAKGQDDVVQRALAWMSKLAYARDVKTGKDTLKTPGDSITVTATVENPGSHTLVVSAIVTNVQGVQIDSLVFMNDGLHGDGAAGDSILGIIIRTPTVEGKYYVSVRTDDKNAGSYRRLPNAASFTVSLTGVKEAAQILPTSFSLDQNYPNPFNPSTMIQYQIPKQSFVSLKVFDLLGREVATLVIGVKRAGIYNVDWDAWRLATGVYFCVFQAGEFRETKRMLLMK